MVIMQNLKYHSEMPQVESNTDGAIGTKVPNRNSKRNTQEKLSKGIRDQCPCMRRNVVSYTLVKSSHSGKHNVSPLDPVLRDARYPSTAQGVPLINLRVRALLVWGDTWGKPQDRDASAHL